MKLVRCFFAWQRIEREKGEFGALKLPTHILMWTDKTGPWNQQLLIFLKGAFFSHFYEMNSLTEGP